MRYVTKDWTDEDPEVEGYYWIFNTDFPDSKPRLAFVYRNNFGWWKMNYTEDDEVYTEWDIRYRRSERIEPLQAPKP